MVGQRGRLEIIISYESNNAHDIFFSIFQELEITYNFSSSFGVAFEGRKWGSTPTKITF